MQIYQLENMVRQALLGSGLQKLLAATKLDEPLWKAWKLFRNYQLSEFKADLDADFESFRTRYSFLNEGLEKVQPGRTVFVLSFSDYLTQVKSEAFLAKMLQLRGLRPVILTSRSAYDVIKYFEVFGFKDFLYFEQFAQKFSVDDADLAKIEKFVDGEFTIPQAKDFMYRGVCIGKHALSAITRGLYMGNLDPQDPKIKKMLRSLLPKGARNVLAAEALLNEYKPEVIFTHHPGSLGEGEIYQLALGRGINTIFWDLAQKEGNWILKRYTKENQSLQPFSLAASSWEKLKAASWTQEKEEELREEILARYEPDSTADTRRLQAGKRLKSREEIIRELSLDPSKPTVVVFSHVTWDASFYYGEDLFDDYSLWLIETTRAACKNDKVNWVIKFHPAGLTKLAANGKRAESLEAKAIARAVGELPPHVKVITAETDINTYSLYQLTDYCVTVRGTAGIEMACLGVPVFTGGTGRYSHRGFTIDSTSFSHIKCFSNMLFSIGD